MPKAKKAVPATTLDKPKTMILRLSEPEHAWVKEIGDALDLALPKVVNLVLGEAVKHSPNTYIDRLKKEQQERQLRDMLQERTRLEEAIKRLQNGHA